MNLFGQPTQDDELRSALFSDCGQYRYWLLRKWDGSLPMIAFIGLNPSTANARTDDPTIQAVRRYAKSWGFGGCYMLNLFPFITPYPENIQVGGMEENDLHLMQCASECSTVVFAWGKFSIAEHRANVVGVMFPNAKALRLNKDGSPHHPLYLPANIQLIDYWQR